MVLFVMGWEGDFKNLNSFNYLLYVKLSNSFFRDLWCVLLFSVFRREVLKFLVLLVLL